MPDFTTTVLIVLFWVLLALTGLAARLIMILYFQSTKD